MINLIQLALDPVERKGEKIRKRKTLFEHERSEGEFGFSVEFTAFLNVKQETQP